MRERKFSQLKGAFGRVVTVATPAVAVMVEQILC
jgi:hypothetical protein